MKIQGGIGIEFQERHENIGFGRKHSLDSQIIFQIIGEEVMQTILWLGTGIRNPFCFILAVHRKSLVMTFKFSRPKARRLLQSHSTWLRNLVWQLE